MMKMHVNNRLMVVVIVTFYLLPNYHVSGHGVDSLLMKTSFLVWQEGQVLGLSLIGWQFCTSHHFWPLP